MYTSNNYNLKYYAIIFGICILAFIIPCKTRHFTGESYSSVYGIINIEKTYGLDSIRNFKKFITCDLVPYLRGNTTNVPVQHDKTSFFACYHPTPYSIQQETSYFTYYRPALCLTYLIEYKLFGLNAYLYYLLIILIHIINSFLLFYFLKFLFNELIALACTLFFTVSPTLFIWLGEMCRQQNPIALLLFLLSVFLLKRFLEAKTNYIYILPASILYLLCICIRETFLITPFLLILAIPLVHSQKHILKKLYFILAAFITMVFLYCIMRYICYPIKINSITMPMANYLGILKTILCLIPNYVIKFIKELYLIFVSLFFYHEFYFLCKAHGLVFIYKIIKDSLFLALAILFILNKQKKMFFYFITCFLLVSWPFFLIQAMLSLKVCCFFYESLPFAAAALGTLLFYNANSETKIFKILLFIFALFFVISNTTGMMIYQNRKSKEGKQLDYAIKNLKANNHEILKDKVFLITNVKYIFGVAQAVQLNFMESKMPKAVLQSIDISTSDHDLTKYLDAIFDKADGSKIILKSKAPNILWFEIRQQFKYNDLESCIEKFEINSNFEQKIYELTIFLKKDFRSTKQALLIWDDACNKFHVIV